MVRKKSFDTNISEVGSDLNYDIQMSSQNLVLLAQELANNYFVGSAFDMKIANDHKDYLRDTYVFDDDKELNIFKNFGVPQLPKKSDDEEQNQIKASRNILVIGAGSSFNSFENIPLGKSAIELIKSQIVVAVVKSNLRNEKADLSITFNELLDFHEEYFLKTNNEKQLDENLFEILTSELKSLHRLKVRFLLDGYQTENFFLKEIALKYKSAIQKWNLLNSKYSNDIQNPDFETFLGTIADILPMDSVRNLLSEIYNYKNAPTLFYSIVAHLFKNRFIDVIINFNFDELLDSAIDHEIGKKGYNKIISDGDCVPLESLTYNGRLRQPLYIKPHGTMSHKSSLRFTKDQYHNLPPDIRQTLIDLMSCSKEKIRKRINLISVGFNLESIEFNEIISTYLPSSSNVFLFFNTPKNDLKKVEEKINEKLNNLKRIFKHSKNSPNIYFIGDNFTYFPGFRNRGNLLVNYFEHHSDFFSGLDNTFKFLYDLIRGFFKPLFLPNNIYKHLFICFIFGNRNVRQLIYEKYKPKNRNERLSYYNEEEEIDLRNRFYNQDYFQSSKYFLDRLIIEVSLDIAVNHGRFDPTRFMEGTGGDFYSEYLKFFEIDKQKGLIGPKDELKTLMQIMSLFNFDDDGDSQSMGIRNLSNESPDTETNKDILIDNCFQEVVKNSSFMSKALKEFLKINWENKTGFYTYTIRDLIEEIVKSNNSKINSAFNDNRNHRFEEFSHADIINTDLQMDLNCMVDFLHWPKSKPNQRRKINTICAVNDFGYKIAKLLPKIIDDTIENGTKFKVFIIVEEQKYFKKGYREIRKNALRTFKSYNSEFYSGKNNKIKRDKLEEIVSIYVLPVEDHNRHMIFFMDLDDPNNPIPKNNFTSFTKEITRAIYYYKKGLSPRIAPIRLEVDNNKRYLLEMFRTYSKKSKKFMLDNLVADRQDQDAINNTSWIVCYD